MCIYNIIMNKEIKAKYNSKALASFKTVWSLFVFKSIIEKEEMSLESFKVFRISDEIVTLYTDDFWQMAKADTISGIEIKEIAKLMDVETKNLKRPLAAKCFEYYKNTYQNVFPTKDFIKLLDQNSCEYCGVTIEKIEELANKREIHKKNERGWSLEIDRINSNYEYKKDNCVMACYWCNNAKTDEFTLAEFKIVGEAIAKIWEKRSHADGSK